MKTGTILAVVAAGLLLGSTAVGFAQSSGPAATDSSGAANRDPFATTGPAPRRTGTSTKRMHSTKRVQSTKKIHSTRQVQGQQTKSRATSTMGRGGGRTFEGTEGSSTPGSNPTGGVQRP